MPAVPIYFENEDYEHSTPPISSNPTVTSVTSQVVLSGPTGSHRVPPFHLQEELRNDCAEEEDPKVESQLPSPSLSDLPSDHRLLNICFVSYNVFHLGQSLFDCFALEMLRILCRYIMYLYIISFVCMCIYIYIYTYVCVDFIGVFWRSSDSLGPLTNEAFTGSTQLRCHPGPVLELEDLKQFETLGSNILSISLDAWKQLDSTIKSVNSVCEFML